MNTRKLFSEDQEKLLMYVQSLFNKTIYLVGGAVRDLMLKLEPKDYDFCSALTTEEIKQQLKGKHRAYLIGEKHGTIGFKVDCQMIEITTFRTENYDPGNRKPKVNFVDDINEDLSRRDFTINSMAIRCDNFKLIDPFNGLDDISSRTLKAVGNAKLRFKEDPLRILRAIRIASKYDFYISEEVSLKIKSMSHKLLEISKERWVEELDKILMFESNKIFTALQMLWKHFIFTYIIPELQLQHNYNQDSPYHDYLLHMHTIYVVMSTPSNINLRWAALLHDIAKPFVRTKNNKGYSNYINHELLGADMAEKLARHLKFSNERRKYIVDQIKNHLNDDCELRQYDNKNKLNKKS